METREKLMKVGELAEFLNCARISIYKLTRLKTGGIPHLRTPGGIRFDKQAVMEYFKNNNELTPKI